jgi:hypothetical protein
MTLYEVRIIKRGENLTVDKRWEVADWDAWSCREWFMRAERDEMEAKTNNGEAWISAPKETNVLRGYSI